MVNVSATILGVTLPTLGIMLLMASIFILVFDKQFGWLRTSDLNRHTVSVVEGR
jgi:hypothetical protein